MAAGAFFTMNVMAFSLVLYSESLYPQDQGAATFLQVFRVLGGLAAVPAVALLAHPLVEGLRGAGRGAGLTDLLILVGVAAACGTSYAAVLRGSGHVYFDTACMTLLFLNVGRLLSARARAEATDSLRTLAETIPRVATLVEGDQLREVPLDQVRVGDRVRIARGGVLPVDGRVLDAAALLDTSIVTGESRPARRAPGERAYAACFNLDQPFDVEVTASVGGRLVEEMDRLLASARAESTPSISRAERVARTFLVAVPLAAAGAFLYLAPSRGLDVAVLRALTVLLVACPCALGIAAPLAHYVGLGRAARRGVAIFDGASLERLAEVDLVLLDKTGTLTERAGRKEDEVLRPEAPAAVAALQRLGLEVRILSGDVPERVEAIAARLGVEAEHSLLPTAKVDRVREASRRRTVLFVGDGLNDGPALGLAQVGIAMGDGTDLARAAADMVLVEGDLSALPPLVEIARQTHRVQGRNLAWTFGYNSLLVTAALGGVLNPPLAAAAMVASSLTVVAGTVPAASADAPAATPAPAPSSTESARGPA